MEYRPPKKPAAALLLVTVLSGAAASLLTFAAFGIGKRALLIAASLLFFAVACLIISRFAAFDCLYRLIDDYSNPCLSFYLYRKKRFYFDEKIEFSGKEELILLNKKGKKRLKKLACRKDYTSNLIPQKRYALLYYEEDTAVYLLLELSETFAARIQKEIDRAKMLYQNK